MRLIVLLSIVLTATTDEPGSETLTRATEEEDEIDLLLLDESPSGRLRESSCNSLSILSFSLRTHLPLLLIPLLSALLLDELDLPTRDPLSLPLPPRPPPDETLFLPETTTTLLPTRLDLPSGGRRIALGSFSFSSSNVVKSSSKQIKFNQSSNAPPPSQLYVPLNARPLVVVLQNAKKSIFVKSSSSSASSKHVRASRGDQDVGEKIKTRREVFSVSSFQGRLSLLSLSTP